MDAGSSSARCYIEYAKLEPDNAKAEQALLKAAGINPKLDEPFALLARRDTDPARRLAHWKAAAERNPRNAAYWQALGECYLADRNYGEAAKAWTAGEQAAVDPAERQRMHAARMAIEQQRIDYEAAERKRQADEDARDLERLKNEARAEVHALEKKYNNGAPSTDPKAVPWWDGPSPGGKFSGTLRQVDCIGSQARLVLDGPDRKTIRLLVTDPGKVAINGPGQSTLGCGAQKPRRVVIEYFPKVNARLATAGEVASIEFQ
jgi:tetratricopeptide (TPR) repeat protein